MLCAKHCGDTGDAKTVLVLEKFAVEPEMCTLCWHWVFRIEEFCKFEVKEKQYLSLFLNLKDYSRGMLWAYSC